MILCELIPVTVYLYRVFISLYAFYFMMTKILVYQGSLQKSLMSDTLFFYILLNFPKGKFSIWTKSSFHLHNLAFQECSPTLHNWTYMHLHLTKFDEHFI